MTPAGKFWTVILVFYFLVAFVMLFDADAVQYPGEEQVCRIVSMIDYDPATGESKHYDAQVCWDEQSQDWEIQWLLELSEKPRVK